MSTHTPVIRHWYERPSAAMLILAVGLVLIILVISGTLSRTQSAVLSTSSEASLEQDFDASVARYMAMGEWYQNLAATERTALQRGNDANVARYVAMGQWFENLTAKERADLQRGNDANIDRYNAMADFYAAAEK